MFIRSQDESIIINWDNVENIRIEPNIYNQSNSAMTIVINKGIRIGNYSTRANARIVLNELCKCIAEKIDYYMPEEWEVDEIWENTSQEQNQQQ